MKPKLSEAEVSRPQSAGARYIARRLGPSTADERKKICRAVDKYAKEPVRTLVVDVSAMKLFGLQGSSWGLLAGPENISATSTAVGPIMQLDCSPVPDHFGAFVLLHNVILSGEQLRSIAAGMKEWCSPVPFEIVQAR